MKPKIHVLFFFLVIVSCSSKDQGFSTSNDRSAEFKSTFFRISSKDSVKNITVVNPLDLQQKEVYLLNANSNISTESNEYVIPTPISRVACISTSHIAFLEAIGADSAIVGALNPELIYSRKLHQRYLNGKISSIGGAIVDIEKLLELNVDLVFSSVYDAGGMEYVKQLRRMGINVVLVSEYLEEDPMQKAEWIRFFAAFFGENAQRRADSIYQEVRESYLSTASLVEDVEVKPEVLTGLPWAGTWYVPGGRSFQSNYLQTAGADYIYSENRDLNSFVVDFEVMLEKGMKVPYWLNVGDAESLEEIKTIDHRFSSFLAFKKGTVFNNNARKNNSGGNDYWESGVVRPDIVLKDLVKIFHPEKLPEHQLFYYQQLQHQ